MTVRWALEEVGQPYEVRLVSFAEMKQPEHLARQPFGQIPTYEDGDVRLFESGAIVHYLGERYAGPLLPTDSAARARTVAWMFAAQSSVEPLIVDREVLEYAEGDKPWAEERATMVDARIRERLELLDNALGQADWLDGAFTAGDLLMVQVLRRVAGSAILAEFPRLSAYVARGEAREAFRRAYAAQRAVFEASQSQDE